MLDIARADIQMLMPLHLLHSNDAYSQVTIAILPQNSQK